MINERRPWFDDHQVSGPRRLLVAVDNAGACVGYASTSHWRPKAAYNTTVESSVYCRADVVGKGCGTTLHAALFDTVAAEDIHAVGRKFDRYWDVAWFERRLFEPTTGLNR